MSSALRSTPPQPLARTARHVPKPDLETLVSTCYNSTMPRRPDDRIRANLLAALVNRVLNNGLGDMSLRPLSAAVGVSPRTLLYHFGSKEKLLAAVLEEAQRRQRAVFIAWSVQSSQDDPRTMLLRAWQWIAAPRHDRLFRLFFESCALGLRDRKRYGAFVRAAMAEWATPFSRSLEQHGFARERAAGLATLVAAVTRGLLLDVLATGDRARADRAFRSFINAIELPDEPPVTS
jgi:AcrR family transcriptional regulator